MPIDRYELKARLFPAIIALLPALPMIGSLIGYLPKSPITNLYVGMLIIFSVLATMSYLASALGRRYERKLWPRWPYDAPTNLWLQPENTLHSAVQKRQWYDAIKSSTGIDIQEAIHVNNSFERDRVINDAVASLRQRFRASQTSDLLVKHNEDYGFARNLAGLKIVWLSLSVISLVSSVVAYLLSSETSLAWSVTAFLLLVVAILIHYLTERFVRDRADRYAESFFGALMAIESK